MRPDGGQAHQALLSGKRKRAVVILAITVALGAAFLGLQAREYWLTTFSYRDGAFASLFFIATGFHGLHVSIGATFLFVCLVLIRSGALTQRRHFAFEAAVWYWHFVDVVWLMLFLVFYQGG